MDPIWSADNAMTRIWEMARCLAETDLPVLIRGETGTGKDFLAHFIHDHSARRKAPFVKVDLGALPVSLMESELFGYEAGSFTGAYRLKPGRIDQADGGTLFLDEIANQSTEAQAKLLSFIENCCSHRLGEEGGHRVDARILAATSEDLEQAVRRGSFRADIYFRLNGFTLNLPPLRMRSKDIVPHTLAFMEQASPGVTRTLGAYSEKDLSVLALYTWPGNLRELRNLVQKAHVLVVGEPEGALPSAFLQKIITLFREEKIRSGAGARSLKEASRASAIRLEKDLILSVLVRCNWNRSEAAHVLRISYRSMLDKIKRYGLESLPATPVPNDSERGGAWLDTCC